MTNTGPTIVNGDLGVSPGTAVVGFPPGIVNGTIHAADAASLAAQNSITTAYNALAGQACDVNLTGQRPGWTHAHAGRLLLLDVGPADGNADARTPSATPAPSGSSRSASTLTTASGSRVAFINGGQACGAFWQVGSSATLGTTTTFTGNILALASITMNTGATNSGRASSREPAR